jgi:Pentapeptide repeats (8 copies)
MVSLFSLNRKASMKDRPFLSGILSDATLSALEAVAHARGETFSELVTIAGLDRTRDLRDSNLCNLDLSYSDLRGFDLTGADLRGATGIHVKWDKTTIFADADIAGSIFAAKVRLDDRFATDELASSILKSVAGADWAEQIIWAGEHLMESGRYHNVAVPITEALFYRAKDNFLKAELMSYVALRLGSEKALREMLLAAISDEPDAAVMVRSALRLFRRHRMAGDAAVRQIVRSLIDSPNNSIRTEAVQFIMRTDPTKAETSEIRVKAESGDEQFGILFVAETARRLGDAYDLVTRDPVSNATFPLNGIVTSTVRDLIARRWLRAESVPEEAEQRLPLSQRQVGFKYIDREAIRERAKQVSSMWTELARYGVAFRFVSDRIENVEAEIERA